MDSTWGSDLYKGCITICVLCFLAGAALMKVGEWIFAHLRIGWN